MTTQSTDPRAIIRDVAKIVGGRLRTDFRFREGRTCYSIECENIAECIEEAARNGVFGAKCVDAQSYYIVYWPAVT